MKNLHLRGEGGYQAWTRAVGQTISKRCPPVLEDHNHGITRVLSLCHGRPWIPHAAPIKEPSHQHRVRGQAGEKLKDKASRLQLNEAHNSISCLQKNVYINKTQACPACPKDGRTDCSWQSRWEASCWGEISWQASEWARLQFYLKGLIWLPSISNHPLK